MTNARTPDRDIVLEYVPAHVIYTDPSTGQQVKWPVVEGQLEPIAVSRAAQDAARYTFALYPKACGIWQGDLVVPNLPVIDTAETRGALALGWAVLTLNPHLQYADLAVEAETSRPSAVIVGTRLGRCIVPLQDVREWS